MNTTDTPTVAVVVPTHNRPELLRRAIDAILSQDYPGRIDVVVVFDRAEPDETLVRDEPTRSVRVTTNVRTPGLPGGRNSGIAMCPDADYLAFPRMAAVAEIAWSPRGARQSFADFATLQSP